MLSVRIQQDDFNVADEYQRLRERSDASGAIVFFVGLVRDFYSQQEEAEVVNSIELQHYPGMSEKSCEGICKEAIDKFSLQAAIVVHRVGQLSGGEQIVFVGTSAGHRRAAFDGAEFIMDFLKTRAPFWKKEVGSRGENWVGMKDNDAEAANRWQ